MNHAREPRPLLTCDGLHLGACRVPAFDLRAGELLQLRFPAVRATEIDRVRSALCAPAPHGPVHAAGRVTAPEFPRTRGAWREILHREQADEWFSRRTGLLRAEAAARLEHFGVEPLSPVSSLAATPRKLMGLLAAFASGAEVVVFDTFGLDPLGERKAISVAAECARGAAAIHLCGSPSAECSDPAISRAIPVTANDRPVTTST